MPTMVGIVWFRIFDGYSAINNFIERNVYLFLASQSDEKTDVCVGRAYTMICDRGV